MGAAHRRDDFDAAAAECRRTGRRAERAHRSARTARTRPAYARRELGPPARRPRIAASCACLCSRTSRAPEGAAAGRPGSGIRGRVACARPQPAAARRCRFRCRSTRPTNSPRTPGSVLRYDVTVRFPDGDAVVYRISRMAGGAPLPRNLLINLILLVLILVIVLYPWRAASPGRCRPTGARRRQRRPPDAARRSCTERGRARAAGCGARLQHHAGPPAALSRQPHARAGGDVARPEDAPHADAAAGGGPG